MASPPPSRHTSADAPVVAIRADRRHPAAARHDHVGDALRTRSVISSRLAPASGHVSVIGPSASTASRCSQWTCTACCRGSRRTVCSWLLLPERSPQRQGCGMPNLLGSMSVHRKPHAAHDHTGTVTVTGCGSWTPNRNVSTSSVQSHGPHRNLGNVPSHSPLSTASMAARLRSRSHLSGHSTEIVLRGGTPRRPLPRLLFCPSPSLTHRGEVPLDQ